MGKNVTIAFVTQLENVRDVMAEAIIVGPNGVISEGMEGDRVRALEVVPSMEVDNFEKKLVFAPITAGDVGVYHCTGTVMPLVGNKYVTNGTGARNITITTLRSTSWHRCLHVHRFKYQLDNISLVLFHPSLTHHTPTHTPHIHTHTHPIPRLLSPPPSAPTISIDVAAPAPSPQRLLDIAPFNLLSLSCSTDIRVTGTAAEFNMMFEWRRSVGASASLDLPPHTFTNQIAFGSMATSVLSINTTQSGNHTYVCRVILDVIPTLDNITKERSQIVSVYGESLYGVGVLILVGGSGIGVGHGEWVCEVGGPGGCVCGVGDSCGSWWVGWDRGWVCWSWWVSMWAMVGVLG